MDDVCGVERALLDARASPPLLWSNGAERFGVLVTMVSVPLLLVLWGPRSAYDATAKVAYKTAKERWASLLATLVYATGHYVYILVPWEAQYDNANVIGNLVATSVATFVSAATVFLASVPIGARAPATSEELGSLVITASGGSGSTGITRASCCGVSNDESTSKPLMTLLRLVSRAALLISWYLDLRVRWSIATEVLGMLGLLAALLCLLHTSVVTIRGLPEERSAKKLDTPIVELRTCCCWGEPVHVRYNWRIVGLAVLSGALLAPVFLLRPCASY